MSRKSTTRSDRLAMENCLRDLVKKRNQRISELEAKLAESEKEHEKCNNEWTEICDGKLETINRLIEEKHQLEQENSNLKRVINIIISSRYGSLSKYSYKKLTDEELKEFKTRLNNIYGINAAKQLAIDELEEVKEKLNKYNKEHCLKPIENYICEKAIKFVDEQIKKVRKEMIENE